ncbi:DUF397 domain-containing protein [Streptomyces buecherae]|uniref:DUF397 domain-containing protein n=1 Tax=Streptomyces buecherae TaxID=2763006 RepID=UPI0036BF2307
MTTEPRWTKSSHSDNGGNCVEVAANLAPHGTVPVRDSKDPHGPTLAFDISAWSAFVAGIRSGDFTA